jgi:CheY-like chemotaxis protein
MKSIIIPVALLLGAAVFVALLMIIKGGYFATKRRKTKLGLVKVAGAGLKLNEEGEPEGSDWQPDAADGGDSEVGAVRIISSGSKGEDADTGVGKDDTAVKADATAVVADADAPATVGALPDELGGYENTEYEETLAVPIESVNDLPMIDEEPRPVSPVRKIVDLPMIDEEPGPVSPVRKIVDLQVENPFITGKGDGHAKKPSTPQRRRLPETVKMKDRKVILAEDVAINRDLIAMYFDGSGVKFEFAVNGREVCEKFERDPGAYSLILMDIQMPEMDGYEVSRRIRAMDVDWAKQIPIIAMTGNDQKEDIDLCFEAGMDDHIPKPIDMEVLQEKVFDIITLNSESF